RSRLERFLDETKVRVGDRPGQDVVESPPLHLLRGAIQEILARRENLDVSAFVIDDEDEIRERVEDRGQSVLAALEIGGARDDAIFELVGVALDTLLELGLPDADRQ